MVFAFISLFHTIKETITALRFPFSSKSHENDRDDHNLFSFPSELYSSIYPTEQTGRIWKYIDIASA